MKKNKFIGIAVASLGAVVSISAAAALYVRAASNTGFGIGAGSYVGSDGIVTYKINNQIEGNVAPQYWNDTGSDKEGTGLGNSYNQVVYEMTLSATYAQDINAQSVTMGNLSVSVTNIPETYRGHLAIWVDIDGYTADTIGSSFYNHVFMTSDFAITSAEGHTSYSDSKDIAVKSSGVQKLRVMLKYDSSIISAEGLYAKDESSLGYSLNVTWGAPSNGYQSAYVVGDGNQWTQDDEYRMVPDIDNATWRWRYDNLPGESLGQAKCAKGSTWSDGNNTPLTTGKHYTVLWNGEGSGAASFTPLD